MAARGGQQATQVLVEAAAVEEPGQGVPGGQRFEVGDTLALRAELALQIGDQAHRLLHQRPRIAAGGVTAPVQRDPHFLGQAGCLAR